MGSLTTTECRRLAWRHRTYCLRHCGTVSASVISDLSRLNIPPHTIAVYASWPPSPAGSRNTRYRAGATPYPDRTFTGWIRSVHPDAPPDSGQSQSNGDRRETGGAWTSSVSSRLISDRGCGRGMDLKLGEFKQTARKSHRITALPRPPVPVFCLNSGPIQIGHLGMYCGESPIRIECRSRHGTGWRA